MSRLFASGGQSIGASASASVPPVNIQDLLLRYLSSNQLPCPSLLPADLSLFWSFLFACLSALLMAEFLEDRVAT